MCDIIACSYNVQNKCLVSFYVEGCFDKFLIPFCFLSDKCGCCSIQLGTLETANGRAPRSTVRYTAGEGNQSWVAGGDQLTLCYKSTLYFSTMLRQVCLLHLVATS